VETIHGSPAPQPVLARQGHGPCPRSDRQPGTAAAAAGANHPAAGVTTHPHAKSRDALALAACSFEGAAGHDLVFAACHPIRRP
jgi:hypothetical protein